MSDLEYRGGARFDRRLFLGGALAGAAGALVGPVMGLGRTGASTVAEATSVAPAGSDLGAIEHVVFLMMENRSFDHYYGSYRGVRGFGDHPERSLGAFAQPDPANTTRPPTRRQLPFHLDTATGLGECTHDLSHEWLEQHLCRNGGSMDAFVRVHTQQENEGPVDGLLTMGYYRRSDLSYYYALADAFTIGDGYHCSVLAPTHPNRLMAISGTIDPGGHRGGPVLLTNPLPEARWSAHWDTMPEVLEDAGVSWKAYNPPGAPYQPSSPEVLSVSDSVLPYFSQYRTPTSALHKKAFAPLYPSDFVEDVRRGTLPHVSWIFPPVGYDEHPPAPPALGEWFTDHVLRTLVANPAVWSKTVLFHMYDENDGFFDHVPPPVPPRGTHGEYVTVRPLPATARGVAGPIGLGFRVPLLVLSPFSRGGYVCSQTFDHTSQMRFLEARFGVRAPNISAWRRRTVGDLTSTLHLGHGTTAVPRLPPTGDGTPTDVAALGCTEDDILGIAVDQPPYPLPAVQVMPTQEPGDARRVPARRT